MMQVQKVIERLGYKANEAKVYIAALGLGESTVSDIASKVRLPRTSVQIIVDKLHKDGLMNFYKKRRFKYWIAENPNRLLQKLEERQEEMRAALPQFEKMRRVKQEKTRIRTFEGADEIRHIYDDMLETKQHASCILPLDEWTTLLGSSFLDDFTEKRVRRYLPMRLLSPWTATAEDAKSRDGQEMRETRFLHPDIPISSTLLIYGSKVAIASLNKRSPTAVLIEDTEVRDTNMTLFEEIWSRSAAEGEESSAGAGLFRVLADSSPQPLLIANEKVEIEYANEAWQKQFGYSIAEVHGKNPRMLQSGKTPREVYQKLWGALRAGKTFQSDEVIDKRKDGTFFNLLTTIFPVRQRGKLYYVQILDDITERKRVEDVKNKFVESTAHDIEPRLESIRGMVLKGGRKKVPSDIENKLIELQDIAKKLFGESPAA